MKISRLALPAFSAAVAVSLSACGSPLVDPTGGTGAEQEILAADLALSDLLPNAADYDARFSGQAGIDSGPEPLPSDEEVGFSLIENYALGGFLTEDLVGPECASVAQSSGDAVSEFIETAYTGVFGPWAPDRDQALVALVRFDDPGSARLAVEALSSTVETCVEQADLYPALEFLTAVPTDVGQSVAYARDATSNQVVVQFAWISDILVVGRAAGPDAEAIEQAVQLVIDTATSRANGEPATGAESAAWCGILSNQRGNLAALDEGRLDDPSEDFTLAITAVGELLPQLEAAAYDDESADLVRQLSEAFDELQVLGVSSSEGAEQRGIFRSVAFALVEGC